MRNGVKMTFAGTLTRFLVAMLVAMMAIEVGGRATTGDNVAATTRIVGGFQVLTPIPFMAQIRHSQGQRYVLGNRLRLSRPAPLLYRGHGKVPA